MGETTWQKKKKNASRVEVKNRALYPSIQRTYKKIKVEDINPKQVKLI